MSPAVARAVEVLDLVNSPRYRDKSPKQIVRLLTDQGEYIASESTIYRILRGENLLQQRSPSKAPERHHRP